MITKMLLEAAERKLTGTLHLAGATRVSRYEFAVKLAKTFGFDESLLVQGTSHPTGWKARRSRDSSLDITKASKTLSNPKR